VQTILLAITLDSAGNIPLAVTPDSTATIIHTTQLAIIPGSVATVVQTVVTYFWIPAQEKEEYIYIYIYSRKKSKKIIIATIIIIAVECRSAR
jgi:hypothetical protein